MFTEKTPELGVVQKLVNKNAHFNADPEYNFVRVILWDGSENFLLLTDTDTIKASFRATRNMDDIEEQILNKSKRRLTKSFWWTYSATATGGFLALLIARLLGF